MRSGILVAAALALMTPTVALAAGALVNSKHDLSSASTGPNKSATQNQLCVFCHVAHNSAPAVGRPLWNHSMTSQALSWNPGTTVRGTTLPTDITSTALNGSRACMSCHDGTIALGDLLNGSFPVTGANVDANGKLNSGVNHLIPGSMQTNHPLGVKQPTTVIPGFTGFKSVPATNAVNYDGNGYVQCDSCHNPHDNTFPPFLKIDNTQSTICTTCHNL